MPPVVVERCPTPGGELVLRRAGDDYEIIAAGVFLMDTRGGDSERLLVRAALDACDQAPRTLLIGGLGVGFSLAQAVARHELERIVVVEISEPVSAGSARTSAVAPTTRAWTSTTDPAGRSHRATPTSTPTRGSRQCSAR